MLRIILAISLTFAMVPDTYAGDHGHYTGGSWSPRDIISPPPGTVVFAPYLSFYNADKARNGNGDIIDGRDNVNVSAEAWSFTPVLVYAPESRLLSADWSISIVPSFGQAGSAARFSNGTNNLEFFDNNATGFGDLYVIPANLTWKLDDYFSLSGQYAFWAPVGKYDSDSTENVGLGYWSHNFRGTISYFPLGNPGILVSASVVQEVNDKKSGFDVTPGNHTTGELGLSVALNEKLLIGAQSFAVWETSKASGADASDDGRDRMWGISAELIYWFTPGKLAGAFRYNRELEVRDRFEGETFTVGAFYLL